MNVKVISRNVGFALLINALFMFMSILVSFENGRDSALAALIISFIITFTVGAFPFIFVRKAQEISLKDGYMIIFLSWTMSFIFGMLPYILWGGPFSVSNAWFESVSGYTTTGATILSSVEVLPKSLLFWRSSTHFIGGLGVVVFLLLIIPLSSPVKMRLSNLELSSLSKEGYKARVNKTVNIFAYVYLALNFACFLCYWICGMSPFESICHAMSICATGGFSTRNLSIASFNSLPITIVSMVFMFLASIHFGLIFITFVSRTLKPLNNQVLKFYVGFTVAASIIIAIVLKSEGFDATWGTAILDSTFNVLSFGSTTGVAISDNAHWPFLTAIILQICGVCLGMTGSTTGGIKAERIVILWNAIRRNTYRAVHPSSVSEISIDGHVLKDEEVSPQILFCALYILIIFVSTTICLMLGVDTENSLIATLSTLGNVGPAVGDLGTFGNYGMQPEAAKFVYTINMFLGRVEIYPIFVVIHMMLGGDRKFR